MELGPSALPFIEIALAGESDRNVREHLVHVASQTRSPEALCILASSLHDSEPCVWKEAIDGLVTLGTTEAEEALRRAQLDGVDRRTGGPRSFLDWTID